MSRPCTITARNDLSQIALPMRKWGSFHPGNGVGGAGNHWAGITFKFQPEEFRLKSHLIEKYGAKAMPEELTLDPKRGEAFVNGDGLRRLPHSTD